MNEETRHLPEKKRITYRTFLVYTALFFIMISVIYSYFVWTNTSFIWESDGFTQHYQLFFDYISKLRGWMGEGSVSSWDWTIGLGADIIHSYGYYVIGDPFVYLGLLFPYAWMEAAYHILILIRVWAIGISFLFFLRSQRLSHHSSIAAAIAYSFTHFVIFNVTRHPFFLLPLIWYPMLCLGIERILKGKSSRLFMVAVAFSAISNFYFFYKLTLLTLLYALVRFKYLHSKWDWALFLNRFQKTVYAYIIGLMISASLFLPMVFAFLDSSRQSGELGINLLIYPLEYYLALIMHTISPGSYFWMIGGFPILSVFGLIFIWRKPEYRFIKTMTLVLGVLLLFPFFGSMMNGFSGPYNRFSFALSFFFSLSLAYFLDNRERIEGNYIKKMKWELIVFSVFSIITWAYFDSPLPYMLFPVCLGWIVWVYLKRPFSQRVSYYTESRLLTGLIMINMAANAIYFYYPFGMNGMDSSIEYGTAEKEYSQVLADGPDYLPERGLDPYRVGVTSRDNHVRNQFLYHDVMGLNSYLSITNGYVSDFAAAIETAGFQLIQPLRNGIDDRRIANHVLGVQYIITHFENEPYLPYGYDVIQELTNQDNEQYILAETTNAYPFAYAIGNALSEDEFMALNAVEREAALVQHVVLEDSVFQELSLGKSPDMTEVREVFYEVTDNEGNLIDIPAETIQIDEEDTEFTVVLDNPDELIGHEWFIRLDGLDYRPAEESLWLRQPTHYRLSVDDGQLRKSIYQSDVYSFSSYFHREHMLFNMGYVEERDQVEQVTISVDRSGAYSLEQLSLYALPVDAEDDEQIATEKRTRALDIHTFSDNQLEGEINADANEVLVTAIPFSTGWSATVNGQQRDVLKANVGFVGISLDEGENSIELTYRTPYLSVGLALSLVGIILALVNLKKPGTTPYSKD